MSESVKEQWQWRGRTRYGSWGFWKDVMEGYDSAGLEAPYAAIQHRIKPKACGAVAPVTLNMLDKLVCEREHTPGVKPHHRTMVGSKTIYWED